MQAALDARAAEREFSKRSQGEDLKDNRRIEDVAEDDGEDEEDDDEFDEIDENEDEDDEDEDYSEISERMAKVDELSDEDSSDTETEGNLPQKIIKVQE
jgi:hypothetical protein